MHGGDFAEGRGPLASVPLAPALTLLRRAGWLVLGWRGGDAKHIMTRGLGKD
jgi:hypothetical protein